ncbi:MAG: hypothetical protein HYW88_00535, partial [Candidatus Sungbacteria bacterium]|nr:hypothetical protein [Candidatus Sungbacteria bacterium]
MNDFLREKTGDTKELQEASISAEAQDEKDMDTLKDVFKNIKTKEPIVIQKNWLAGFRAIRQAGGDAGLKEIFKHNIFKQEEADFLFKNFSREGWESVKEIFGKERAEKALRGYSTRDIFAFSKSDWQKLIEAFGEKEPFSALWSAITVTPCVREWILATERIKGRKAYMAEPELEQVMTSQRMSAILVHDGRKDGWMRTEPDAMPDFEKYPIITEAKWQDWRNFWGNDWIPFLKLEPAPEILETMTPQTFESLFGKIPSWKERFMGDPNVSDIVRHLSDWKSEETVGEFTSAFESLGKSQKDFFKERTMREIVHFASWYSHWYGKGVMRAMKEVCSPEYAEKIFKEPVTFFEAGGDFTRAQYPRAGVPEERVYDEYKKTFRLREKIDGALERDGEIAGAINEFPEFLPWLRMRYADAMDRKLSPEFALKDTKAFLEKIKKEASAGFDEAVIPSVGAEIEVMTKGLFQK